VDTPSRCVGVCQGFEGSIPVQLLDCMLPAQRKGERGQEFSGYAKQVCWWHKVSRAFSVCVVLHAFTTAKG
jgi:hypothetical protein